MPERPQIPPPEVPIRQYTTPVLGDGFYTERVDYTDGEYREIERGAKYADQIGADQSVIAQFPDLRFLKETREPRLYPWGTRIWATDRLSEDTYNSVVEYVTEAVNFPSYTRVYMVRRDAYDASPSLALGIPLDSLVGVKIIDPGGDYTNATFQIDPENGASIDAVIDKANGGQIVSGVITNQGSGFTSAPILTIVGDGGGASAIGIIQPQTAVLVSQKKTELSEDHPLRNEYVLVTRVYETLPGQYITTSRVDEDGKTITVKRRHNLQSTIDAIGTRETLIGGVWTRITSEPVNESYFVGWEVRETRAIPGNPISETTLDKDGNEVQVVRTLKDTTAITTGETTTGDCSSGTYVKTYAKAVSDLVAWEYVETIVIPGNTVETTKFRSDGSNIVILTTLKKTSCITPGGSLVGGFLSLTRIEDVGSDVVSHEVVEVSLVPGPDVHGEHIDERYGLVFDIVKTIVPDGTSPSPNPAVDGTYYEIKPHDKWQSVQIATKLDTGSLPSDNVTYGGQHHGDFPPVLVDAVIEWADATCGCVEKFRAVLQDNYKHYRGVVKAKYTEQFYNGVPPDDVTVYQFFPQQHTFGFAFASVCGCGSDSTSRVTAIAPQFHIPLCLHDDITLCVGGGLGCVGAPFAWTFAATTPSLSTYPASTYIMLQPHVERWRFGVYRRVLTEIFVPPLT